MPESLGDLQILSNHHAVIIIRYHVFTSFHLEPLSIHPHPPTHTVSRSYCGSLSDLSDSQICNVTPLTCESQQSAFIAEETFLEAATASFFGRQMSAVEKSPAGAAVSIAQIRTVFINDTLWLDGAGRWLSIF